MLSWLAQVFLTLAGYSAGAVLSSRLQQGSVRAKASPGILDAGGVMALWVGGVASRLAGAEPWQAIGVFLVSALVLSFLIGQLRPQPGETATRNGGISL